MKLMLKHLVERVPYSIGRYLAAVPFSFRLGVQYSAFKALLAANSVDDEYVVEKFSSMFEYAKQAFPFYESLYREAGVYDLKIKTLADIECLPIVTKAMIRGCLAEFDGCLKLNTGGTSGSPFEFFVDKGAFPREWAHMHSIWAIKDYDYRDIKLTLRGKNLGGKSFVYNPVHNEFIVNTYLPATECLGEIVSLIEKHDIQFVHGYPSAIYNFFKELDGCASQGQRAILKKRVKTCLLGSEFPVPYMVQYLSDEWGLDYISWYGHSEMCILAYDEFSNNEYKPYHSYGYAEVDGDRLIGTSYHNFDMPLIRYDTGDLVSAKKNGSGLLQTFAIKEGRSGDFVTDKKGKKIALTGLVFGRHHEIFGHVNSVQVRQTKAGQVEFLITTSENLNERNALPMFDLSNVDIEFSIQIIPEPILTAAGKMPLKVQ